ncbi:MAG: hypothetical protein WBL36_04015 [Bacilli bacterium]|jgi:hypothetical protein
MKDTIVKLFDKADEFIAKFLAPIINKIINFLSQGEYTIYALITIFVGIILLIGLFRWVFKGTKSFIFFLFLFGAVFAVWLFLGK